MEGPLAAVPVAGPARCHWRTLPAVTAQRASPLPSLTWLLTVFEPELPCPVCGPPGVFPPNPPHADVAGVPIAGSGEP